MKRQNEENNNITECSPPKKSSQDPSEKVPAQGDSKRRLGLRDITKTSNQKNINYINQHQAKDKPTFETSDSSETFDKVHVANTESTNLVVNSSITPNVPVQAYEPDAPPATEPNVDPHQVQEHDEDYFTPPDSLDGLGKAVLSMNIQEPANQNGVTSVPLDHLIDHDTARIRPDQQARPIPTLPSIPNENAPAFQETFRAVVHSELIQNRQEQRSQHQNGQACQDNLGVQDNLQDLANPDVHPFQAGIEPAFGNTNRAFVQSMPIENFQEQPLPVANVPSRHNIVGTRPDHQALDMSEEAQVQNSLVPAQPVFAVQPIPDRAIQSNWNFRRILGVILEYLQREDVLLRLANLLSHLLPQSAREYQIYRNHYLVVRHDRIDLTYGEWVLASLFLPTLPDIIQTRALNFTLVIGTESSTLSIHLALLWSFFLEYLYFIFSLIFLGSVLWILSRFF